MLFSVLDFRSNSIQIHKKVDFLQFLHKLQIQILENIDMKFDLATAEENFFF